MNNVIKNEVLKSAERSFNPRVTKQQIYASGWVIPGSWGLCNEIFVEDKAYVFDVKGLLFQGTVIIVLAYDDTYTIKFIKRGEVVRTVSDVYCDQLTNVIDEIVEQ